MKCTWSTTNVIDDKRSDHTITQPSVINIDTPYTPAESTSPLEQPSQLAGRHHSTRSVFPPFLYCHQRGFSVTQSTMQYIGHACLLPDFFSFFFSFFFPLSPPPPPPPIRCTVSQPETEWTSLNRLWPSRKWKAKCQEKELTRERTRFKNVNTMTRFGASPVLSYPLLQHILSPATIIIMSTSRRMSPATVYTRHILSSPIGTYCRRRLNVLQQLRVGGGGGGG